VSTYADEIAAFMNNYERPNSGEPGRFASLWAYSQGGVAALYVLNDGYTPLDAFRDDESLLIRTVAAEFQGTPASGTWLWGVKPIARAFVRSKMLNCRFRGQTLQLSPTVATLRLAQVKRRSREATAYRRTIHRIAGTRKNFCFWLTSIPFIWGYDDGIAQNSRSALYKGAVAVGVDRELCHAGSKFWIYPFAVDQSSDIPDESPIPEELCQGSFLGDIDGFVCPEAP
jgi:hypothetical protein